MKKTNQHTIFAWIMGIFPNLKGIFVLNPLRKSRFNSLLTLCSITGTLLFTSCSQDALENQEPAASETQDVVLALKAPPTEPIIIDDLTTTVLKTTEAPGVDRGRFNITLKYLLPPTERQVEVFEAAAARWERIIIKDVPSFTGSVPSAFQGFPDIEGTIDDVVIEVALAPIDGPGGILGQAGPSFVRTSDFLPLSGVMFFDVDDLDFLEELDLFEEVIVHEMGHVLGLGTLWNVEPYYARTLRKGPNSNPYFTGKMANVFWNAEGGTGELPIENMGGPGTALGHWRESILKNELMTGYLNLGENPLSRITAGSMRDLGYGAAMVGEKYDLPRDTPGVDPNNLGDDGTGETHGINIANREVLLQPIGFVNTKKK
ncbi:leishmanolysin-related zinc metalloendopeptidase [Arenibacter certesii]|uniref:Zinc metalloendopeptidase n=1 Tax=Arenibacter certesii TaxID=228955 RepID=A0A918J2G4_9FLAO|nr:leishmanolysin-related zinc metalloendopeptidase [Arenibacter certesii]GGW44387.1 zinc metalloendopeptidase [Arenibacter certesii]